MLSVLNMDLSWLLRCRHGFECHCVTVIVKLPLYGPQSLATQEWPTWWGLGPRQLIPILAWLHWLFLLLLSFSQSFQSFPFVVHSSVLAAFQCISQLCLTNLSLITTLFLSFSKLLFWIGHYVYCLLIPGPFYTQLLCWVVLPVAVFSRVGSKHRITQSLLSLRSQRREGLSLECPSFV